MLDDVLFFYSGKIEALCKNLPKLEQIQHLETQEPPGAPKSFGKNKTFSSRMLVLGDVVPLSAFMSVLIESTLSKIKSVLLRISQQIVVICLLLTRTCRLEISKKYCSELRSDVCSTTSCSCTVEKLKRQEIKLLERP